MEPAKAVNEATNGKGSGIFQNMYKYLHTDVFAR